MAPGDTRSDTCPSPNGGHRSGAGWPSARPSTAEGLERTLEGGGILPQVDHGLPLERCRFSFRVPEYDSPAGEADGRGQLVKALEPGRLRGVVHEHARLRDVSCCIFFAELVREVIHGGLGIRRIHPHAPRPRLREPVVFPCVVGGGADDLIGDGRGRRIEIDAAHDSDGGRDVIRWRVPLALAGVVARGGTPGPRAEAGDLGLERLPVVPHPAGDGLPARGSSPADAQAREGWPQGFTLKPCRITVAWPPPAGPPLPHAPP